MLVNVLRNKYKLLAATPDLVSVSQLSRLPSLCRDRAPQGSMHLVHSRLLQTCLRTVKHISSRLWGRIPSVQRHGQEPRSGFHLSLRAGLLPIAATTSVGPEPPSALIVVSILAGLPLALWTYKSIMMVLFQRRIIYMGYAPLGARTEKLRDLVHTRSCDDLNCEELNLTNAEDGTNLSGLLVTEKRRSAPPKVVIVYFQGNAGNSLHRLPVFQRLHRSIRTLSTSRRTILPGDDHGVAILAVAPRSYWTSDHRRPTQPGILSDYRTAVNDLLVRFPECQVVLYGHSLGGAAAVCLLAEHDRESQDLASDKVIKDPTRIRGLILENPFSSIAGMVRALYPQRWVPYKYLTPFIYDRWDALKSIQNAHLNETTPKPRPSVLARLSKTMLVMVSEHDEVVPRSMGESLFLAANTAPAYLGFTETAQTGPQVFATEGTGAPARLVIIPGALHENAWGKRTWEKEMGEYLRQLL